MCSNQQNYRDAHQNNFAENRIKSGFRQVWVQMHPRGCIFGKTKMLSLYRIRLGVNGDDIYTTGATLEAATSLLKDAGATCVEGLVLASNRF